MTKEMRAIDFAETLPPHLKRQFNKIIHRLSLIRFLTGCDINLKCDGSNILKDIRVEIILSDNPLLSKIQKIMLMAFVLLLPIRNITYD